MEVEDFFRRGCWLVVGVGSRLGALSILQGVPEEVQAFLTKFSTELFNSVVLEVVC